MTQIIQRLERDGLVSRLDDPLDGRATLVGITGAGRARLDELRRARRERTAALLATLAADDEMTLADAMETALPILERLRDIAVREAPSPTRTQDEPDDD
jgi:DNA-binding MarR family transcriptional regulator